MHLPARWLQLDLVNLAASQVQCCHWLLGCLIIRQDKGRPQRKQATVTIIHALESSQKHDVCSNKNQAPHLAFEAQQLLQ